MITAPELIQQLRKRKFMFTTEKVLQGELEKFFRTVKSNPLKVRREYYLDQQNKNIIDFFFIDEGIGIEVKIKGSKRSIYNQLERYSKFEQIKVLILITNKAMGVPETLNNKDVYVHNISLAWL
jgi:predicted AAA+ superfamily ATPase